MKTLTILLSLLLVSCASQTPSWQWQVQQDTTKSVTITCPEDDVVIGLCKYGGTYMINVYDKSKKNCFGPSINYTNVLIGHRQIIAQFELAR